MVFSWGALSFVCGSSSTSSATSSSLLRRSDELEEVEAVEGRSMMDSARADSESSDASVNEKTLSWGLRASRTDWNWTVSRTGTYELCTSLRQWQDYLAVRVKCHQAHI